MLLRLFGVLAMAAACLMISGDVAASGSVFVVNSTGDEPDANPGDGVCGDGAGACTLRAALMETGIAAGPHRINFIIGSGAQTISPASQLPLASWVTIDGTTQPGFAGTPIIELNGQNAGNADGLQIAGTAATVKGLVINRFGGAGIQVINHSDSVIEGNFIGTDVSGTLARGNGRYGIELTGASNTRIGGGSQAARNVISGNGGGVGIFAGSDRNAVQGNYIGTDATGGVATPNSEYGILVRAGLQHIGGAEAGLGNVISGNGFDGIAMLDGDALIQGNIIGLNNAGTTALGNGRSGVWITGTGTIVGEQLAEARNVISGNGEHGVSIASGNSAVIGNYIGTNAAGTAAIGNAGDGVRILSAWGQLATSNQIEGGNLISGNGGNGVHLCGMPYCGDAPHAGATIYSNRIGTDVTGANAIPNGEAGVLTRGAYGNIVSSNDIAFNTSDGVRVQGAEAYWNSVIYNSIHSNGGKGIETIDGGNGEPTPPVITGGGPVTGTACANCNVHLYSDDTDEGRLYDGSAVADGAGHWSFAGPVAGPNVTASSTDAEGESSEFSAPFAYCTDSDYDGACDATDLDDDNDLVYDAAESSCGGDPLNAAVRPERVDGPFAGVSDDGDAQVDEPLPPGSSSYDCDGDGYVGSTESAVPTSDQDPCGFNGWPSDLKPDGANALNLQDLASFVAPTRRLGTSSGDAGFSKRWDIVPGSTAGTTINVQDMGALLTGSPGNPPMFGGQRAFGKSCPWP